MKNAWRKYGQDSFSVSVILECAVTDLVANEQIWLDKLCGLANCMNIGRDAWCPNLGRVTSSEVKKKISVANTGKRRSDEFRQRMREFATGRVPSEETRKRMGDARRGKKRSAEFCRRISEAHAGRRPKALLEYVKGKSIAVVGTNKKTGETLLFETILSTAAHGFIPRTVGKVVAGKLKSHHGYTWRRFDIFSR